MSPKRSIVLFLLILQQLAVAQSLQPDPRGMVSFNVLGDSFFQAQEWEQARIHYEQAFTKLDSGEDSVLKQVIQRKIADALRMESKFELASEYYFRALQGLKALEAEEELIETMAQISVHLSSTDPVNAIAYADSALARARTLFPNDSLRIIKYLFQLADRYRTAIEYEECVTRYSEVLNLLERLSPTDSFLLFNAHFRLGGVLCRLDRRAQSLHQYEIAEKLLLEKYSQDEKLLRNFYQDVAFLLEDMGDFGQALEYRQRYCDYFFTRGDSTSFEVSRAMNNLGLTHERRGEYEQAMYWYQKVLHNNRRIYGPVSIYTAFLLNNVGNIYKHLGEYEKGLPLLKEAYKIFSNYFGDDHVYPANVSSNIGNVYNLMGQPMQALPYNLAALNIRRNKLGPYHEDLSRDYQLMGDIYSNLQDYASAIRYYDSAAMATKYLPETGFEPVISHHRLYQSMEKKAHAYDLWYEVSRDLELLKEASEIYQKIDAMTDFVRNSFKSEGSKRFLLHKRRSIYEDAVADLTTLHEGTGDTFYFDEALRFSEKTRSILLFEALLSSRAENFGNIPGKLRADITIQRQRTSELEKQFFELQQNKTADSEKIDKLEGQLFTARNEYQRLIEVVASNHPAYFNLKYQVDTRSGQDAQALLSDDQVFLEYLIGSDRITVFIISSEKKMLIHLPLDFPLRQWIKELRESIYGYVLSPQKSRALFDSLQAVYVDRAQVIYDKVLRPIEPYLVNKSTIIISPDQELNYLPFATL
ncbi:MAG: tetratricopeptide repeat protein, partial [Saprospiraceae bacterium]|nr:tetratricopeptide repeat protein [Saprospiraceae bacterium]